MLLLSNSEAAVNITQKGNGGAAAPYSVKHRNIVERSDGNTE